MMQWKARQWVYRDTFGDILRGMRMAEELHDIIEMEPSATGEYSAPQAQPEPEAQVSGQDFDDLLPPDVDRGMLERYAETCAAHFGQDIEAFKASIVANGQVEEFLKAYRAWEAKQAGQTMDQGQNGQQHQAQEADGPKEEESPAPWQAFRSEFINLRNAGFSTWIFKNRDRLAQAPDAILQEARENWSKLYPANKWPLEAQETKTDEPAPVDVATGEILTVACPERDGKMVSVKDCDVCNMREGCPSWEE